MPALKDLTGARFGKLVVSGLHPERTKNGGTQWICRCDCGNEKVIRICNIGHNTNSCGCVRNTQSSLTRKHPLWSRWAGMIARCTKPTCKDYPKYGTRGIKVCERWMRFPNFLEDMEASFVAGATIDRINNDGNYEPTNCRWASARQQNRNRRCSNNIETPWGKISVAEAAERLEMPRSRFATRVRLGWSDAELFDPTNTAPLTKWDRRSSSSRKVQRQNKTQ